MTKAAPVPPHVDEGDPVGVVVRVELHEDCEAVNPPLTVCLDVWDTRPCTSNCQGVGIYGDTRVAEVSWQRAAGRMMCNSSFLQADTRFDPLTVGTEATLWIQVPDDNFRSDRQDYLIIAMYNPLRHIRIPIRDND